MDTELISDMSPELAEKIANTFPVPDALQPRICMMRHLEAVLVMAVEAGLDPEFAGDWLTHYRDRLGI